MSRKKKAEESRALESCQKFYCYLSKETASLGCRRCGGLTKHYIFVVPGNQGKTYPNYWCSRCYPKKNAETNNTSRETSG